ncbi:MAG: LacI family transcriptional regulator, partial [Planctomycetota bacterium]
GYRQALTQHGLKFSESLVSRGGLTPECGYRAMQRLLELETKPDAIFAFNDMVAIGAIRACSDSGLNIPRDIGVVGFDDIPIASYYEPPLTTIRQPVTKMGREGVKMLLEMLGDKPAKNSGKNTVLKPELIVRKS